MKKMIWRYVDYVEYYDLIKAYGLDLKLIERLKWNMVWSLENNEGDVSDLMLLCIEECTGKPIDGNRH